MLDDFILPSRVNQNWIYSGMDSPEECLSKLYFARYPHQVTYNYNSRGFRDREWPTNLQDAIWCVGDSFTVGLGAPVEHTWPYLLEQHTGRRCINISMDGASNNWIGRKVLDILEQVNPKSVVIHWSHLHRRENNIESAFKSKWHYTYNQLRKPDWPKDTVWEDLNTLPEHIQTVIKDSIDINTFEEVNDENRRLWHIRYSDDDIPNTINYIREIGRNAIHSFVPGFAFTDDANKFYKELNQVISSYIPELEKLDYSRDHHHYDILTATKLVEQITPLL